MPYRRAWLVLTGLLVLTTYAFWPNYISGLRAAAFETHVHSIPAMLWMILMTVQSWSIHAGHRKMHRTMGLASLGLFPLFLAGGLFISVGMAKRLVIDQDTFHVLFAARLAPVDALGMIGVSWCFYRALQHRRKVHLHARFMLATLLFVLSPIALRVLTGIGPFAINGDAEYYKIAYVMRFTTACIVVGLAWLIWRDPRHGRPWIEVGLFIALQAVVFETLGRSERWSSVYPSLADVPPHLLGSFGIGLGIAVSVVGWFKGSRSIIEVKREPTTPALDRGISG